MNERVKQRLDRAKVEFFEWVDGKRDKPPVNPFLPPQVEEGGLVDPYMPEGRGTEIELFRSPLNGFLTPEQKLARQVQQVREDLRKEVNH